MRQICIT